MKFSFAGILVFLAAGMAVLPASAQTTTYTPPAPVPATPAAQPGGKVILSRSTDENGNTTTQAGTQAASSASAPAVKLSDTPTAEDAERQAVTFTDFDLDVHLRPLQWPVAGLKTHSESIVTRGLTRRWGQTRLSPRPNAT